MKIVIENRLRKLMELFDGHFLILKHSKGEKVVAKPLKEKPTYGKNLFLEVRFPAVYTHDTRPAARL